MPHSKLLSEESKKYLDANNKHNSEPKKENQNNYINKNNYASGSNKYGTNSIPVADSNQISFLKASDVHISKLMSNISPTTEDLISTFKKKTSSLLLQGVKQCFTTPTTNKNSRKNSSDKVSDKINNSGLKILNGVLLDRKHEKIDIENKKSSNLNLASNSKVLLISQPNSNLNNYLTVKNKNNKNIINFIKNNDGHSTGKSPYNKQENLFTNELTGESYLQKVKHVQNKNNPDLISKNNYILKNVEKSNPNNYKLNQIIGSNPSLSKKTALPFSNPVTIQNSKINSKTSSKSSSRMNEKIDVNLKKKQDDFNDYNTNTNNINKISSTPVMNKNIVSNSGKISFNLNFKKHSTNTNSPSHFNFLLGDSKENVIKIKEFMKDSKKNSIEKNNSTLSKYKEGALKTSTKPVSLKFNQSSNINIGVTQPNPTAQLGLSKPNTNTNSKENLSLLLIKNTSLKKPYTNTEIISSINTAKVNLYEKISTAKYFDINTKFSHNKIKIPNNAESSSENILNISTSSVKSTVRESNYYKREAEKISNYIKQYYDKNKDFPQTTLHFYKYGRLLGRGAFGKVNLGLHIMSGRLVAVKSFNKTKLSSENANRKILQEVNLMKNLRHNSIVKIFEMIDTQKYLVIVMEYICGGDLLSFVRKRTKLNEITAKFIFKQIIEALQYIHTQNIVHRDIKLDNILIDLNNNIKICDFGVGKQLKKAEVMYDQCGTPAYIAPEILINKGYEGFGVDIWSAGVVLYTMLSGKVPFKANKMSDLHKIIISGNFTPVENISEEASDIINGILEVNPKKRLNIQQILSHPWINSCEDINNGKIKPMNKMNLFTNAERILLSKTNIDYCNANKDDLIEIFTVKNLDTLQETENQNVMTKSAILAPYNSSLKYTMEKLQLIPGMSIENAVLKFCGRVKESNRNYELNNNGEIDNGILINLNNNQEEVDINDKLKEKEASIDEDYSAYNNYIPDSNKNSNFASKPISKSISKHISKHVSKPTSPPEYVDEKKKSDMPNSIDDSHRNSRKNPKDLSISNANTLVIGNTIFKKFSTLYLDENIVKYLEGIGYKKEYVLKCLQNYDLNYASAAYYLLLNSTSE